MASGQGQLAPECLFLCLIILAAMPPNLTRSVLSLPPAAGHPSRGAAAPAQDLVHVALAGGGTSPGAAVASSGLCPPPPGEAQDGFLHLEGGRPRAQIRVSGRFFLPLAFPISDQLFLCFY